MHGGLYDMHGNVLQWCADWYDQDYYFASPHNDPTGPASGRTRVVRGGSWDDSPGLVRSAHRGRYGQDHCDSRTGFRIAQAVGSLLHDLAKGAKPTLVLRPIGPLYVGVGTALNVTASAENAAEGAGKLQFRLEGVAPPGATTILEPGSSPGPRQRSRPEGRMI